MKPIRPLSLLLLGLLLPAASFGATLVDDTFADGNSQNQDLASNSIRLFNGRSANPRTDAVGSTTVAITVGSEAFWGFFTNSGAPVNLQVGDTLNVNVTFSTGNLPGSDIRFDLMNSNGTRNTANLTGGQNDATFGGDLGYAAQIQVPAGGGNPFGLFKRLAAPGAPGNPLNSLAATDWDPVTASASPAPARMGLQANTDYTITFNYFRQSPTAMVVTIGITGGTLSGYSFSATDTSVTNTAFDYFSFRIAGTAFATSVKFSRMLVNYTPAVASIPPSFTAHPAPQTVAAGGQAMFTASATGVPAPTLRWQRQAAGAGSFSDLSDDGTYSGTTSATLTVNNAIPAMNGDQFRLSASNLAGTVPSNPATLTVNASPELPGTVAHDTFSDGSSRNQNLALNSFNVFDGRNGNANYSRVDAVGSATFNMLNASASSSQAFWAYFTGNQATTAGSPPVSSGAWSNTTPVSLEIGDTLTVNVTFSVAGLTTNTGQDIRFGLLNSKGTRNTASLGGGHNDATFGDDVGYSFRIFPVGTTGNPFEIGKRNLTTATTIGGLNNMFNDMAEFDVLSTSGSTARQALTNSTPYTISFSALRQNATTLVLNGTVSGGTLAQPYSWTGTDLADPVVAFDSFVYRFSGVSFASALSVTDLRVRYTPAVPVITQQPTFSSGATSQIVGAGGQVIMNVTASGNALTYQWYKGATPVPGATTASITLMNLQLSDTGIYTVVVSNAGGSTTSDPITLTVTNDPVDPAPAINSQPASQAVNFGTNVTLAVGATGNGLTYQWFKNNVILVGQTGAALNFPAVQPGDAGIYKVSVSNSGGTVPSANATLTVLSTTLTPAALFPLNSETNLCTDTHVSLTFATPPALGASGFIRIFDAVTNTPVDTIDVSSAITNGLPTQNKTIGALSNFNYYPVIITGNRADIYFRNNVLAYNKSYYITVDSGVFRDAQGVFAGISGGNTWRFTTKLAPPAAGTTALTVAAEGTGDFCTVQGAVDFVPAGNTTHRTIFIRAGLYTEIVYFTGKHSLTFLGESRQQTVLAYANNNNFNPAGGAYHRMVFNADHSNDVVIANLTVNNTTPLGGSQAEAIILNGTNTSRGLITGVDLNSYQDTLQINGQGYISNSHISGNTDYMWGNGPNFFYHCQLTANAQGGYYTQIRNPVTTTNHGNVYLDCLLDALPGIAGLYLSRIDPIVFPFSEVVYLNCAMGGHILPAGWLLNNAATAPNIHFWEYNSHDFVGNPVNVGSRLPDSKQLTLPTDSVTIANYSTPSYVLGNGWTPQLAPMIVTQPMASTVDLGGAITLSVGVVAVPDPTYQWLRNGLPVPGATSASYVVASAIGDDAATYSVVVTNSAGSVTSAIVPLIVNGGPPVITLAPQNQIALTGATASFSVAAVGNGPFSYQWNKNGGIIAGATGRSLRLTNVQAADIGSYSVTVSNSGGPTTSGAATLTPIAPAAPIPPQPVIPPGVFNVADYGAVGDGVTDNAAAIQAAIAAARTAGGGTIEIPPAAQIYLSGPLTLFSNMNFQVDGGATLQAISFGTYPNSLTSPAHFITVASGSSDVEFSGSGTIDGNGAAWWAADAAGTITARPRLIQFTRATNVLVTSLTLKNAPQFHVAFSSAHTNVTVFGLTISAPGDSPNTDGLDPAGTNFLIQNCAISVGDDNIAVKPGSVFCTGFTIANCTFGLGHGLSVGGQTNAGLDGMVVKDCTFNGTQTGLRLKADPTEGGPLQNVTFSNITMTNVPSPIVFYSYYNIVGSPGAVSGSSQTTPAKVNTYNTTPPNSLATSTIPTWKNITIENLTATGATAYSIIWGLPLADALIQNVTLRNVNISGGPGFEIYDATNVQFTGSSNVGAFTTANALAITGQPQNRTTSVGGTVSFSAAAAGASGLNNTPPAYQWKLEGVPMANGMLADGTVVSGATTQTLTLSNVHGAEAGSYALTVSNMLDGYNIAASALAPNSLPVSATSSAALLTVNDPYAAWVALYGLAPAQSGFTADGDADGIGNLLEYYLGLNPTVSEAAGLPVGKIEGGDFVFRYTHSKTAAGATAEVQVSGDLVTWLPAAAAPQLESETPVRQTLVVKLPLTQPRLFARLVVTAP